MPLYFHAGSGGTSRHPGIKIIAGPDSGGLSAPLSGEGKSRRFSGNCGLGQSAAVWRPQGEAAKRENGRNSPQTAPAVFP